MHKIKWVQIPLTSCFSPWSLTVWHDQPHYGSSNYFPTDHLKQANSNSYTMKIRLTSVTISQGVAQKSWVATRASLALWGLAVITCTISMALTKVIPSLVAARITPCSTLKFLILQINYFKLLCILACSYEICAIKVLPHNPHLHLDIV